MSTPTSNIPEQHGFHWNWHHSIILLLALLLVSVSIGFFALYSQGGQPDTTRPVDDCPAKMARAVEQYGRNQGMEFYGAKTGCDFGSVLNYLNAPY